MYISSVNILKEFIEPFLGYFCHRDLVITGAFWHDTVGLCPRCAMLHMSFLIGITLCGLLKISINTHIRSLCVAMLAMLFLEWSFGQVGMIADTTFLRCLTGGLGGIALGVLMHDYAALKAITIQFKTVSSIALAVAMLLSTVILHTSQVALSIALLANLHLAGKIVYFHVSHLTKGIHYESLHNW